MITLALAAAILGQTISDGASVIHSGIPASVSASSVRMISHSATAQLGKTSYVHESTSLLKNESDKPVTLAITVPANGQNTTWPMLQEYRVSATIDNVALNLSKSVKSTEPDEAGKAKKVVYGTYQASHKATVTFAAGQSRALRTRFTAPLGRAGLDGLQRMVVYETAGARTWNGSMDQLNYSLQFSPSLVFQVFAALPQSMNWQIGPNGAFIKKTPFVPEEKSLVIFTYYPGGFGNIGGG